MYVCVCRSIFRFIWILFLLYAQLLLLVFPHSMRMCSKFWRMVLFCIRILFSASAMSFIRNLICGFCQNVPLSKLNGSLNSNIIHAKITSKKCTLLNHSNENACSPLCVCLRRKSPTNSSFIRRTEATLIPETFSHSIPVFWGSLNEKSSTYMHNM